MIKTYEKYIDEYKKDSIRDYFYGKNELLNKLYGFEDRGEFTIEVLDELLELQQENQQLKKQKADVVEYIKNNAEEYKWEDDDGAINKDYCCEGTVILRMLGEIDNE